MADRIYYFSGTGNSFDVARRISSELGCAPPVSVAACGAAPQTGEYERVGVVFPVYGFAKSGKGT
jgi:flavodoxin